MTHSNLPQYLHRTSLYFPVLRRKCSPACSSVKRPKSSYPSFHLGQVYPSGGFRAWPAEFLLLPAKTFKFQPTRREMPKPIQTPGSEKPPLKFTRPKQRIPPKSNLENQWVYLCYRNVGEGWQLLKARALEFTLLRTVCVQWGSPPHHRVFPPEGNRYISQSTAGAQCTGAQILSCIFKNRNLHFKAFQ